MDVPSQEQIVHLLCYPITHNFTPFSRLVRTVDDRTSIAPVKEHNIFANVPPEHRDVVFDDPSALSASPGWPLRNPLAAPPRAVPAEDTGRP
ncbi:hypothetical protein L226DRAFT_576735 [Lentinus tigrinus ALCF2SS1-7]|uniref:uncharacterized protein n=1 Tax=Lentinus tigrinus ALCF2SS1-7 TaxID=1328758 RepID=UPI0011663502|nr:hypothetical protein L226DRAFT_576735 [Lentinus tigrinus ALCF2SS1-7]